MALALAGLLVAIAMAAGGLGATGTSPPASARPHGFVAQNSTGPTWDNGVVSLAFSAPFPSFAITSLHDRRVASRTAPTAIAELGPAGNVSFLAPLEARNATWTFASVGGVGETTVWANGSVPVAGSRGGWEGDEGQMRRPAAEAKAKISLSFYLNDSTSADPSGVRFAVNVTNWPWNNASDSLAIELDSTAVTSTVLAAGPTTNQVVELRAGTNRTVASLSWDTVASVVYGGGGLSTSAVGTFQALARNGSNSTIRLSFGSVRGGYSELEYDPLVQLSPLAFQVLPGPLLLAKAAVPAAWTATPASLEAIAAGTVAASLLAAVAWRSRASRPEPE
jgi:hypothetical protein